MHDCCSIRVTRDGSTCSACGEHWPAGEEARCPLDVPETGVVVARWMFVMVALFGATAALAVFVGRLAA